MNQLYESHGDELLIFRHPKDTDGPHSSMRQATKHKCIPHAKDQRINPWGPMEPYSTMTTQVARDLKIIRAPYLKAISSVHRRPRGLLFGRQSVCEIIKTSEDGHHHVDGSTQMTNVCVVSTRSVELHKSVNRLVCCNSQGLIVSQMGCGLASSNVLNCTSKSSEFYLLCLGRQRRSLLVGLGSTRETNSHVRHNPLNETTTLFCARATECNSS